VKSKPPGDYDVGFGKPPVHTRFKPGRSGNPKGRPKGSKNFKTLVNEELDRPVTIKEGGKEKTISRREAMAKQLVKQAVTGDHKAMRVVLGIEGLTTAEDAEEPQLHLVPGLFDESDRELLRGMLDNVSRRAGDYAGK
jgi:hypothetical protein